MFERLKFLLPPSVPVYNAEEKVELGRKAARMAASGNVLVQFGNFLTKEDVEFLRDKALNPCK
jgi:hypothetical protein